MIKEQLTHIDQRQIQLLLYRLTLISGVVHIYSVSLALSQSQQLHSRQAGSSQE